MATKPKARTANKSRRAPARNALANRNTKIARRPKSNPAVSRAKRELEKVKSQLRRSRKAGRELKEQLTNQPPMQVAVNAGVAGATSIGLGAIKGYTGMEYFMRVPVEAWVTAAAIGGLVVTKQPLFAYAAVGAILPLLSDAAEEFAADLKAGEQIAIPEALFGPAKAAA